MPRTDQYLIAFRPLLAPLCGVLGAFLAPSLVFIIGFGGLRLLAWITGDPDQMYAMFYVTPVVMLAFPFGLIFGYRFTNGFIKLREKHLEEEKEARGFSVVQQ